MVAVSQPYDEPSAAHRPDAVTDAVREDDLERVLRQVPRGALALCGLMVAITMIGWLAVYFGVFIPRGPVS